MTLVARRVVFCVTLAALHVCLAVPVAAQDGDEDIDRPTVQRRFAVKDDSLYLHLTGTTHIRNDFYSSFGAGLDVGFYPSESFGLEVRGMFLETHLSSAAVAVRERTGLTPDARPQSLLATAGPRLSWGYGKILAINRFVLHFDPQLTVQAGVARAETRLLPTIYTAMSLLIHLRWGIQVKLDLGATIQMEKRDRGWVTSVGFLPVLGLGWNYSFHGDES